MIVSRVRFSRRNGVAPVIAELMLMAITLTTAAALGSYFFGLIGTYSSPAVLSIQPASAFCVASGSAAAVSLPDGTPVPPGQCGMTVVDTGTGSGSVVGAGPKDTFTAMVTAAYQVPANGHVDVFVRTSALAGSTLSGFLGQTQGPDLMFSVVVQ